MASTRVTRFAATLMCLGALLIGACSSDKKAAETTTTTTAASNRTFQVTTEDGQVSISLDGQLPPNWPSDFPLPDGAEPAGSGSLGGSDKTVLVGVYTAPGTAKDTYDFYTSSSELTVETSSSFGVGSAFVGTIKTGGDYAGRVTVLSHDDETLILVVLETAGTSNSTGSTGSTAGTQPSGTSAS